MIDSHAAPLADLMKTLPVPKTNKDEWGITHFQHGFEAEVIAAVPELRKASGDCPACMMAALRQSRIPVPLAEGFSFTDRMKEIWADVNEREMDRQCY